MTIRPAVSRTLPTSTRAPSPASNLRLAEMRDLLVLQAVTSKCVTALFLSNFGVSGPLDGPWLPQLDALTDLRLYGNHLTGARQPLPASRSV